MGELGELTMAGGSPRLLHGGLSLMVAWNQAGPLEWTDKQQDVFRTPVQGVRTCALTDS